jgi:hypothetical protein
MTEVSLQVNVDALVVDGGTVLQEARDVLHEINPRKELIEKRFDSIGSLDERPKRGPLPRGIGGAFIFVASTKWTKTNRMVLQFVPEVTNRFFGANENVLKPLPQNGLDRRTGRFLHLDVIGQQTLDVFVHLGTIILDQLTGTLGNTVPGFNSSVQGFVSFLESIHPVS